MSTKQTPPTTQLKVLVVEDMPDDLDLLLVALKRGGFEPDYRRVETAAELKAALEQEQWQIVISDFNLPQFSAKKALEAVKPYDIPFFVLSGTIGEDIAVDLMRSGAQDYVMKGNPTRLIPAIYRELDAQERRRKMQSILRQKEEQLLQSQKMEALGRIAGGIAHDFNNFLSVILTLNEVIETKLGDGSHVAKDLQKMRGAVEGASGLTRQLLMFSRRQPVKPQAIDLNGTLNRMSDIFRRVLGELVELNVQLNDSLSRIKMDQSQLDQTLMNLVVNARDAMPSGGRLSIISDEVHLESPKHTLHGEIPPGRYVRLTVEDTGIGMDEMTMKRIFEPFFSTKGNNGTGLGLATVYGIIENANGHIDLSSTPGQGTQFEIYFPACFDPAVAQTDSQPVAKLGRLSGHVLLVEDNDVLRVGIKEYLESAGMLVSAASRPKEAIRLAQATQMPIDLLVTDLMMPEMSGVDLIKTLRLSAPYLKAILISGFISGSDPDKLAELKNVEMLLKPFAVGKLHALIAKSLTTESVSRAS